MISGVAIPQSRSFFDCPIDCWFNHMMVPPRIHIEFASESPKAVILRRGPTRWVQLLLWDTSSDAIEPGSWFHGRIYENGCSISPDGKLFAYFASKYHGEKTRGVDYAWTAVSKPPWLTAIALWPQADTWGGRATFVDNKTLIIDCPHWFKLQSQDRLPRGFTVLPRWIGRGAPEQCLAQSPVSTGHFQDAAGVDQSGRAFEYVGGKLIRDGAVIADLASTKPDPQPSPEWAHSW
jgi:hypothetical protein